MDDPYDKKCSAQQHGSWYVRYDRELLRTVKNITGASLLLLNLNFNFNVKVAFKQSHVLVSGLFNTRSLLLQPNQMKSNQTYFIL